MWLLPSRGRPAACQALLDSMVAHGMTALGVLLLTETDSCRAEYEAIALPEGWFRVYVDHPGVDTAKKLRVAFGDYPASPWYGWIADDVSVETHGFEQRLVAAAGAWGIAGANDLWLVREDVQKTRILSGACVFGGDLVRSIGYLVPDGLIHLYMDDVWETIARDLGNWRALMDVITPNNHPMKTGAAMDATTGAANAPEVYKADAKTFKRWKATEAPGDITRARWASWEAQGLSLERARKRTVMLAFPVYDRPHMQHEAAAMETVGLLSELQISHGFAHIQGQPIHTARNMLVKAFLDGGFTDILFIDADMAWRPYDVVRLLAQKHPFIGGVGRKRNDTPITDARAWCFSPIVDADCNAAHDAAGAIEVNHVGTGFLLVNRLVFEALEQYGKPPKVNDADGIAYTQFFRWGLGNGCEFGEDYQFCRDYRAIGGKVMVDPSIELSHFGTSDHKAKLSSILM